MHILEGNNGDQDSPGLLPQADWASENHASYCYATALSPNPSSKLVMELHCGSGFTFYHGDDNTRI